MKIVVIGGTGLIGSKTVAILRQGGHEVVAASPNTGVNTITGEGVKEAVAGAQVVIDLANSPSFDQFLLAWYEYLGARCSQVYFETVENGDHRLEPEVWEEVVERLCRQRHGGPWTRSPNRFDKAPGPGKPSTFTRYAGRYRVVSTARARLTHTHACGASVR
jgi:hypothetical protein